MREGHPYCNVFQNSARVHALALFFDVLLHGFPVCGSFFSLDKVGAFCYSEGKEMTDIRNSNREQYVCWFPKRENDF